jgi:hypothetical protein
MLSFGKNEWAPKPINFRSVKEWELNQVDMMPEKVLYTDGHDVTVTDSTLQVRSHEYKLSGVMKCGLMILQPRRAPGIILLLLGIGLIIAGVMKAFDPTMVPDVNIAGNLFTANTLAMWVGGALALIGLLVLGMVRERYAVRIQTAEGERDAVVSDKKEYIRQIVDAINQAVTYVRTEASSRSFTIRNAT